jgi:hypothetical protein
MPTIYILTAETPAPIEPFINPAHWGGHTLGVGEAVPLEDDDYGRDTDRAQRFAAGALRTALGRGAMMPLQTYRTGDSFNTREHAPGTVVSYCKELLTGPPLGDDYDLAEIKKQPPPRRATEAAPNIGANGVWASDGIRNYTDSVRWGVVPEKNESGRILQVSAGDIERYASGGISVRMPFMFDTFRVPVGGTLHELNDSTGVEILKRVNILHVIACGEPSRSLSRRVLDVGSTVMGRLSGKLNPNT